ncbi:MAG: MBL fold metallo-hydrolase [Candidatus Shapirobacteria bacterium]|jgi:L-ascorbate metabolism protein UlaG (beta-lactamase superfamily)
MKITKYPQSCLLIETKQKKILTDPGSLLWDESFLTDWKNIDAILITHKHSDHCNYEMIRKISENEKIKIYSSNEVCNQFPDLKINMVKENDLFDIDGIKIEVVKAIHGYLPTLKGEKEIYENIGFIIDDNNKRFYITSDTICFENNYKCDAIAIAISNHGLVMGGFDGALFAKETGAKLVIPTHYDNSTYPVNMVEVENDLKKLELNYKILEIRESLEI